MVYYIFHNVLILSLLIAIFIYIINIIYIIYKVRTALGQISKNEREVMKKLIRVSHIYIWHNQHQIFFLYFGISAFLIFLLTTRIIWILLTILVILEIWRVRVRTITPPLIILLGKSTNTTLMRQIDLKKLIKPLRVVSLLNTNIPWNQTPNNELFFDCYRTTNDEDWWIVVTQLIKMTSIIIIDTNVDSKLVEREAKYILSNINFLQKCVFLSPPDGSTKVLDNILPKIRIQKSSLNIVEYDNIEQEVTQMLKEAIP